MLDSAALQGHALDSSHDAAPCYLCEKANGAGPAAAEDLARVQAQAATGEESASDSRSRGNPQHLLYAGSVSGKPLCRDCVDGGHGVRSVVTAPPPEAQGVPTAGGWPRQVFRTFLAALVSAGKGYT